MCKMSKFNNEDVDILKKYFRDIKTMGVELLTPEEEVELAIRIKDGDQGAIDKLINANLKFVVTIANDYAGKGVSLSDLINEGNYGLIKAAKRFDHTRGFKFISYAVWWVKQSILQCLNDHARTIRLPVNVLNKTYQLQKELEQGEIEEGKIPLEDLDYLDKLPKVSSLNFNINEDGDEIIDMISEDPIKIYEDEIAKDLDLKKRISDCMEILDERERDIMINYYGLFDNQSLTLEVIGEKYDLTKERVRQIKSRAIKKLKYNLISIVKAK